MLPLTRLRPDRLAILGLSAFALAGCSQLSGLLAPDVSQAATALRAGAYENDPAHTALTFEVDHLGLSSFTGRFETIEATLDFDEADPSAAQLDVRIVIDSLDVANPEFRETLLGSGWFDAERFPEARFTSAAIEVTGETTGTVTGNLTLSGVTAPVTLDVIFNGGAMVPLTGKYTLGFDATGTFSRTAFGLDSFTGFVGDEVTIAFSGEFVRQ